MQHVLEFYGTDFDPVLLPTHLEIFGQNFPKDKDVSVSSVVEFFQGSPPHVLELMSQVGILVELMIVMPATNAVSERSFSATRRIKSYLRTTMSQQRLTH